MKNQVSILLIAFLAISFSSAISAATPAEDKIYHGKEEIMEKAPSFSWTNSTN
jgi:hypothetical protein